MTEFKDLMRKIALLKLDTIRYFVDELHTFIMYGDE